MYNQPVDQKPYQTAIKVTNFYGKIITLRVEVDRCTCPYSPPITATTWVSELHFSWASDDVIREYGLRPGSEDPDLLRISRTGENDSHALWLLTKDTESFLKKALI